MAVVPCAFRCSFLVVEMGRMISSRFDALINYASGIDAGNKANPLSRFWPADMHVVGKDISWFHSVIWPTMLMSAGMELPKSIVVHGFIAGPDGRKMSKSLGNVIDAHDELDTVSPDTFRSCLGQLALYINMINTIYVYTYVLISICI